MALESPVLLSSYARCGQERSFAFAQPVGEVVAATADEVRSALSSVERAVGQGLHAAGFCLLRGCGRFGFGFYHPSSWGASLGLLWPL